MWANTQPHGGIIVIGVQDDGQIAGCKSASTETLNRFEQLRQYCPDAKYESKRVPVVNMRGEDDFVVVLRVYHNDTKLVETVDHHAFIREGDQRRELQEAEKREIRLNRGELLFELEDVNASFPDDFDADLLATFRDEYVRKRSLRSILTVVDVLVLAKMGRKATSGFKPNVACFLLFGRDSRSQFPGAFIRIIRYDGSSESFGQNLNIVSDHIVDGPLPKAILQAESIIGLQVRSFTRLGPDGRFVTNPEYPKDVWLEALVNAVVHRSYNLRHMNIFVKLFEDRMVVESPGSFFPPTTAQTVYEAHNPRNSNLMWAMYYFDFVKCGYEGTRRMRDGMLQAKLPEPVFVEKQAGAFQVHVVLQNAIEHRKNFVHADVAHVISESDYIDLSNHAKMIINCLVDKSALNVTEAALLLDCDWAAAKAVLDKLEESKIIKRRPGKDRDPHRKYFIVGKPKMRR